MRQFLLFRCLPALLAVVLSAAAHADGSANVPFWSPPPRPGVLLPGAAAPGASLPTLPPPRPTAGGLAPPPAALPPAPVTAAGSAGSLPPEPGEACRVAILGAAARYAIPASLMLAMSLVESGRTDPRTGARLAWPWTADIEGQDYRFASAAEAAAWLRAQQARHVRSIDTGCMQVNLMHHPDAFATAEQAFDPVTNAQYAARFLRSLYDGPAGRNWLRAAGFYHSQTPELAQRYEQQVALAMHGPLPSAVLPIPGTGTVMLASAAAGGGQSLDNNAARARVLPLAPGQVGRSLASYRRTPILAMARLPQPAVIGARQR
jgi:hypothetical protein